MSGDSSVEAAVVREARDADGRSLLDLQLALDAESSMMMLEDGERTSTVAAVSEHIRAVSASPNSTILVAEAGDLLVGYVEAEGGAYRRTRHCAYVVIGVRNAWQGRGIGTALLETLEQWACEHGMRRLELTVRVDNDRAHRAYERAGYAVEGVRRGSLLVGEQLVDEIAMARVLPRSRGRGSAGSRDL